MKPIIYTLSSGSSGNSVYVSSGNTSLLIDAGISMKATEKRLAEIGASLSDISAIFITHEHSDHVRGIDVISKHYHVPIYLPTDCAHDLPQSVLPEFIHKMPDNGFETTVGDIMITAFPTPHDSNASVGYVFTIGNRRFGLATDMGIATHNVASALCGCERIIIEANYDKNMLAGGAYPEYLKRRIASSTGHLENTECAKMIAYLALEGGVTSFLLAHLSAENNTPETALTTVRSYLENKHISVELAVASRSAPSALID